MLRRTLEKGKKGRERVREETRKRGGGWGEWGRRGSKGRGPPIMPPPRSQVRGTFSEDSRSSLYYFLRDTQKCVKGQERICTTSDQRTSSNQWRSAFFKEKNVFWLKNTKESKHLLLEVYDNTAEKKILILSKELHLITHVLQYNSTQEGLKTDFSIFYISLGEKEGWKGTRQFSCVTRLSDSNGPHTEHDKCNRSIGMGVTLKAHHIKGVCKPTPRLQRRNIDKLGNTEGRELGDMRLSPSTFPQAEWWAITKTQ